MSEKYPKSITEKLTLLKKYLKQLYKTIHQKLNVLKPYQTEAKWLGSGMLITLCLYGSRWIYSTVMNLNAHSLELWSLPLLLIKNLFSGHIIHTAALTSALIAPPLCIFYIYYLLPRWRERAIAWMLLVLILMSVWLVSSHTAFNLLVFHTLNWTHPLSYIHYWLAPSTREHYFSMLSASAITGILATLMTSLLFIKQNIPNIYGQARFATPSEIRKAGLYKKQGLKLGRAYGQDLMMGGYEHSVVFAPTGTGKSLSFSVPNLFCWEESCIVSDIKLTLFEMTSGYRQSLGHEVYLWNPASPEGKTHCYNPLDIISDNPYTRIDEIQKIAAIFIPDNPKSEPIWQVQSRFLFVALVLYILDTPGHPKTIAEVVRLVKAKPDFAKFVQETVNTRDNLDPLCQYNLMKFGELHEKTRLSILATFQSYFELFDNPLINAATSKSDFDIRNLRRNKMTIYVGITNDNIVRLSPLLSVFYQQTADVLTRQLPRTDEPYGVLFLMDEFSSLRRMESFHKNIGLYREYRLRISIIIQEMSQLYDIYGRDGAKVFLNAKVRIAFAQNDLDTCEYLEKLLGNRTIKIKNKSSRNGKNPDSTQSEYYHSKPLLSTQEIRMLPDSKSIVIVQGIKPIYAKKINWQKLKIYNDKKLPPAIVPSVLILISISQQTISRKNIKHKLEQQL